MKKLAIITIHGIPNFGSVLQAFALQYYINNYIPDIKAEIIDYDYRHLMHRIKRIRVVGVLSFLYNEIVGRFKKHTPQRIEKLEKFQKFRDEELSLTDRYSNPFLLRMSRRLLNYDAYIAGSDQIWNTKEVQGDTVFLLDFISKEKPKISFGSSFGIDYVHNRYRKIFAKYLKQFLYLGVRELKAKEIIRDLGVDVPVEVTCDPTLLLGKDTYMQLACKSTIELPESYILVYGLAYAFNPMPALKKVIMKCVEKFNCKVVFLSGSNLGYQGNHQVILNAGPYDFLNLFAHAKYVITSSFHGTVFSLINHIPFTPIAPEKGDTRIVDLLSTVGLEQVIVHPADENFTINSEDIYSESVKKLMQDYISSSKNYLNKVLKVCLK